MDPCQIHSDSIELGLRLGGGRSRYKPGHARHLGPGSQVVVIGLRGSWNPGVGGRRVPEVWRQNSDNDVGGGVQDELSPDDFGVASEAHLPRPMAQEDDLLAARDELLG